VLGYGTVNDRDGFRGAWFNHLQVGTAGGAPGAGRFSTRGEKYVTRPYFGSKRPGIRVRTPALDDFLAGPERGPNGGPHCGHSGKKKRFRMFFPPGNERGTTTALSEKRRAITPRVCRFQIRRGLPPNGTSRAVDGHAWSGGPSIPLGPFF